MKYSKNDNLPKMGVLFFGYICFVAKEKETVNWSKMTIFWFRFDKF